MSWVTDQEIIEIAGKKIPILREKGSTYYPVRHMFKKLLDREHFKASSKYDKYFCIKEIEYGCVSECDATNIQSTNCCSEEGLKEIVKNMNKGTLKTDKAIKNYQAIRDYLKLDNIKIKDTHNINYDNFKDIISDYDIFMKDCITSYIEENRECKWRICKKCGKIMPLHSNFYTYNTRDNKYNSSCRDCQDSENVKILHGDAIVNKVYKNFGEKEYYIYRNNPTIYAFKKIMDKDNISLPRHLINKKSYLEICKFLVDENIIRIKELTAKNLKDKFGMLGISSKKVVSIEEIYSYTLGDDYWKKPWLLPKRSKINRSMDECCEIFSTYLSDFDMSIDNVLDFNYGEIIKKACIRHVEKNGLDFIVKYNNYKYAGYMFKTRGNNYYKDKKNRIFDMKFLIEKDLKLPIEKTPLYITRNFLKNHASPLYYILNKGIYYKNLFQWIEDCYPNRFIEADFNIGVIRNKFDSIEESKIHEILKSSFRNTIYNQRNTEHEIRIKNLEPDWFILLDNKCILVEYFGLYSDNPNNSRTKMYAKKMKTKLERYEDITNYEKLFIYPYDLKDDNKGLLEKIETIKRKYNIL